MPLNIVPPDTSKLDRIINDVSHNLYAEYGELSCTSLSNGYDDASYSAVAHFGPFIFASIIVGLPGHHPVLVKIKTFDMTRVGKVELYDLPAGPYYSFITSLGGFIYIGTDTVPAKLGKVEQATMADTGLTWAGAAGQDNCKYVFSDGTWIYAVLGTTPAQVVQIDPATMLTVATWTGAAGEDVGTSGIADGTWIYVGLNTAPAKVVQIDPATMLTSFVWTGVAGENTCNAITTIFGDNIIFIALNLIPLEIVIINTVLMTTVISRVIGSDLNVFNCYALQKYFSPGPSGPQVVSAALYGTPSKILSNDDSSIAGYQTSWTGDVNHSGLRSLTYDGGFLYGGFISIGDVLVSKIDPTKMNHTQDQFLVYSHPDGIAEEDAILSNPPDLIDNLLVLFDVSALTQITTFRVYIRVDGVNYIPINIVNYPTDFPIGVKGIPLQLYPLKTLWKVTIQSTVAEGAIRSIPYRFVTKKSD